MESAGIRIDPQSVETNPIYPARSLATIGPKSRCRRRLRATNLFLTLQLTSDRKFVIKSPTFAASTRIDAHVHIVGTGMGDTGCWYRPRGFTKLGAPFLVRCVGLTTRDLNGRDFDRIYVEQMLTYIRGSSIGRVLILAHELPYLEDGTPLPERASFYVPNAYVLQLAQQHPEFLAAVSIHPSRKDAFNELELALAGGAAA